MGRFRKPLLVLCFVLSGLTGLSYETAWSQQLSLIFGTSELALVAVLAAYMGGLALGAAVAKRWLHRLERPVLVYAGLELLVGISALSIAPLLRIVTWFQGVFLGGLDLPPDASLGSAIFQLLVAFAVLVLPTAAMGATLPILADWSVDSDEAVGATVGLLYGANTLGAALGAALSAFVLLPRFGLGGTILATAAINFAIAAIVYVAFHDARRAARQAPPAVSTALAVRWVLPAIFATGAIAFAGEVMWARLLAQVLGGTVYAFGGMLAAYLLGLAIGSTIGGLVARERRRARVGFAIAQVGIAVSTLASLRLVDLVPELLVDTIGWQPLALPISIAILAPAALCSGAAFPLAVRLATPHAAAAGTQTAQIFVFNTLGAICGAIIAGFLALPSLGFVGTASAIAIVAAALALLAGSVAAPRGRIVLVVVTILGIAAASIPPRQPWSVLRTTPLRGKSATGEITFFEVGRSANVMLVESPLGHRLLTNGLPESTIQPPGSRVARFPIARFLALLPLVVKSDLESVFVVGLGGGITAEALPPSVTTAHVVELEPAVVRANRSLAHRREKDPLSRSGLRLVVNDARSALLRSDRRYDAIVSQPSHPWTAGAANLFSWEFVQLVNDRLEDDGAFVQWIGLQFIDEDLLRSMIATLAAVYPRVEVYLPSPGGAAVLFGSKHGESDFQRAYAAAPRDWQRLGLLGAFDLQLTRVLDDAAARSFAGEAPLITDWNNRLMTGAPRILDAPIGSKGLLELIAEARLDALLGQMRSPADVATVRRLLELRSLKRAEYLTEEIVDLDRRRLAESLRILADGRVQQARAAFRSLLDSPTAGREALLDLLRFRRQELVADTAPAVLTERIADEAAASLIVEGWRFAAAADLDALRSLDEQLAAIDLGSGLALSAVELRIGWRSQSDDPVLVEEALVLQEAMISNSGFGGRGLLRRARIGLELEDEAICLASLEELLTGLGSKGRAKRFLPQINAILAAMETVEDLERLDGIRRSIAELSAAE